MLNHTTYAAWPVACRVCSDITTANFKQHPLACEVCQSKDVRPMSDPHEWSGDGEIVERWDALTLTDGHYRCPKCNEFELRFGTDEEGHGKLYWD